MDPRLLRTLRLLRSGDWTYRHGSPIHPTILTSYANDLGYPSSWGDPVRLPAFGGPSAQNKWKVLGVNGRQGLGGIPCELVHGGVGTKLSLDGNCTANLGIRGVQAFFEAILLYLPVSFPSPIYKLGLMRSRSSGPFPPSLDNTTSSTSSTTSSTWYLFHEFA